MALTGKVVPYKTGFGPSRPRSTMPNTPTRCTASAWPTRMRSVEHIFKYDVEAERVAAIILEPVQGEGGFYVAPPEFIAGAARAVRQAWHRADRRRGADRRRRTGTWLACEQWGVAPDIVTMAKSMAGGFRSRP